MNWDNTLPILVVYLAKLLMGMHHYNPLTVSNTKSLKLLCGNFTFETLNLQARESTLKKIVPQGLIRNTACSDFVTCASCIFCS